MVKGNLLKKMLYNDFHRVNILFYYNACMHQLFIIIPRLSPFQSIETFWNLDV